MFEILTYQIIPYLRLGYNADSYLKPGSEWVRDAVKGLMHSNSKWLKERNVDTSLFHNHDETSSRNKPDYPRIIYHFANSKFSVTGINEGAYALEQLMTLYHHPVETDKDLIIAFHKLGRKQEFTIEYSARAIAYRLTNYLPFSPETFKKYELLNMAQKIELLRLTISKHLVYDLFKYLQIPVFDPLVEIIDILKLDQKRYTYKDHHYLTMDLLFRANLSLPDLLTLGNGKAFGYGLIEKYLKPADK